MFFSLWVLCWEIMLLNFIFSQIFLRLEFCYFIVIIFINKLINKTSMFFSLWVLFWEIVTKFYFFTNFLTILVFYCDFSFVNFYQVQRS